MNHLAGKALSQTKTGIFTFGDVLTWLPQATRAAVYAHVQRALKSGKMHALLCREYVKGRDWYDFVWYCGARIPLNHALLSAAIEQNGPWAGQHVRTSDKWVRDELRKTISRLDWRKAREDVEPFIHETELASLQYFNAEYFMQLADRLVQAQNVR